MAGRTGGIWRRLRYLNKWRAIRDALTPEQSLAADKAPETRARFAMRQTPFPSSRTGEPESRPEVAKPRAEVAMQEAEEARSEAASRTDEKEIASVKLVKRSELGITKKTKEKPRSRKAKPSS